MSDETLNPLRPSKPRIFVWRPRHFFVIGALLMVAWLGLKAWRLATIAGNLQQRQAQAQMLLAEGPRDVDPALAGELVSDLRADVVALKRESALFMPLAPLFGWLPRVGDLVTAGPQLLTLADAGTAAATHAYVGLEPALPLIQDESIGMQDLLPALLPHIAASQPAMAAAAAEMERAAAARAALTDTEALPWRVRQLLQLYDEAAPLAEVGLALWPVLPELLGQETPHTYLILAQNEDELRGTGGFISGAGLITIDNGRLGDVSFQDASLVADFTRPYDAPPAAYDTFMGIQLLLFRDANYWPDFPTSAAKAMELFTHTTDIPVDGVIAFDQRFVEMLVCVIGPLQIPDFEQPIACQNVLTGIRDAYQLDTTAETQFEAVANRKSFMGPLATAVLKRLQSNPGAIDLEGLIRLFPTAVAERHLQVYLPDPVAAAALANAGWSNPLELPEQEDFFFPLDMNVGYNKVNTHVDRSLTYEVWLDETPIRARAGLTYRHNLPARDEPCRHELPNYGAGGVFHYDQLADGCYWNFIRVFAPAGAQLLDAAAHPVPQGTFIHGGGWDGEALTLEEQPGAATFGNFILVPYGQQQMTYVEYVLPPDVVFREGALARYRLTVRKQAGTSGDPLRFIIHLPARASLRAVTPEPDGSDGQTLTFESRLEVDRQFSIEYQP